MRYRVRRIYIDKYDLENNAGKDVHAHRSRQDPESRLRHLKHRLRPMGEQGKKHGESEKLTNAWEEFIFLHLLFSSQKHILPTMASWFGFGGKKEVIDEDACKAVCLAVRSVVHRMRRHCHSMPSLMLALPLAGLGLSGFPHSHQ